MKKVLTIVAVASAMALVVGTGSAVNAAPKALKIELISKGETAEFWQAVKKGAEDQAKKMLILLIVPWHKPCSKVYPQPKLKN
jgi:ribose transport system substrate-binding protein